MIQKARWKSKAYSHFREPEIIIHGNSVKYKFVCRAYVSSALSYSLHSILYSHPSISVTRDRSDDSTGNLTHHVKYCDPQTKGAIIDFAAGTTYSAARARFLLSSWCANRSRPFTIVKDPEFIQYSRMLYTKVDIPSPSTISRDIIEMHSIARDDIINMLKDFKGKIHIGIDGWASANVLPFLGVTIAFCRKSEIEQFTLEFVRVYGQHSGSLLAEELARVLEDFHIDKKVGFYPSMYS